MGGATRPGRRVGLLRFREGCEGAPIATPNTATIKGEQFIVQTSGGAVPPAHVHPSINPADVVIACAKEGYKQTRVIRRPIAKANPPKPVETECRMERG
jgi:hypothetical protein